MDKISNIVGKRLNQHQIGDSARASEVVFKANQHLSVWLKCEKEEVNAIKIVNGILTVGVGNATWGQEVYGVNRKLLRKLQEEFGEKYIQKVVTKSLTLR